MTEYVKNYIEHIKDKSVNTIDAYRRDLKDFSEYMKKIGIDDIKKISGDEISMYRINLENENKSSATINRKISVVNNFFVYLRGKVQIEEIDFSKYKSKEIKKEMDLLTRPEYIQLLASMDISKTRQLRNKIMILFMYHNGLKPSQIIEIKKSDIDFSLGIINVDGRYLPLKPEILSNLKAYLLLSRNSVENDDGILFLSTRKSKMTRQAVWKSIKKHMREAGIHKDISANSLHESYKFHKLM